jgi:oligopeptide/dipeptide ABC transporter ATP-binding protein
MIEFARVILAEASLSYLGLGVQPPDTSWGLMVAENQAYLGQAWWTVVLPGAALTATVLALNLAANWLAVQTDPTQRSRRFALGSLRAKRPKLDRAESPPPGSLLTVEGLRVAFHTEGGVVPAVQDLALSVAPGDTVGIVGESGSGKSTTALALMDLVPPPGRIEHAAIAWDGQPLQSWKELRALRGSDITMIFQDPMTSLNPLVPIGRQISESLTLHRGMGRRAAQARAEELLAMVGVPSPRERLQQFPHELSGGLRQRVMIAIALAPEPKLVIADEPTTALDATIQSQILELIADLQRQLGIAMILITHDLGVVARVCDRVLVMYGGRLVEWAQGRELFHDPRHRYTEALLAAAPTIDFEGERLPTIPGTPPRGTAADPGCPFVPRCAHATELCGETPLPQLAGADHGFSCWNPAGDPRPQAERVLSP